VDDVKENETSPDARKSPVETRMAVMTMINAGTDLLTGQGMANAEDAAGAAKDGSSSMFAAVSGGQLRAESGSHATTKGLGLNLGFAKEIKNKKGKLLFGPVLEYGHGNYDSYQDNGITADGKTSYWGLGIIAKQTNDNGFYYEGSVRVGRAKSDYGSDNVVENSHISYDSTATYWAAHLGAGKLVEIGHDNTLDYYGKYFYSHTGGDSATIYRDGAEFDEISFSGVNSNRLRVGARLTHALNEKNKIYGGLAYQYEFSGSARATYREGAAPSPSVKGSSGLIELGWQVKPGKKSPMTLDLGVTGWVGKQRGVTANLQANWTF
jgi:outer membrane autotransporter protein